MYLGGDVTKQSRRRLYRKARGILVGESLQCIAGSHSVSGLSLGRRLY